MKVAIRNKDHSVELKSGAINPATGKFEGLKALAKAYGVCDSTMASRIYTGSKIDAPAKGRREGKRAENKAEMQKLIAGIDARKALIASQKQYKYCPNTLFGLFYAHCGILRINAQNSDLKLWGGQRVPKTSQRAA